MENNKKLYRSRKNQMIGGVCAGLAEYFEINLTLLRIVWLALSFLYGIGFFLYLVFLIVLPVSEPSGFHQKNSGNFGLFGGVILVLIGLSFLLDGYWPLPFFTPDWLTMLTFHWEYVWPILLMGTGLLILLSAVRRTANTNLVKSTEDKKLAGVCSGLSGYWKIDVSLIRVGFILFAVIADLFIGIAVYIILAIILPEEKHEPIVE